MKKYLINSLGHISKIDNKPLTVYELAQCLEDMADFDECEYTKAANMLRQQADRIAELEKDLALKTRDRDVFRDFTLAYEKRIEELEKLEQDFIRVIKQTNPNKPQTKPLSDDEVDYLVDKCSDFTDDNDSLEFRYNDFARAIEERHGIK